MFLSPSLLHSLLDLDHYRAAIEQILMEWWIIYSTAVTLAWQCCSDGLSVRNRSVDWVFKISPGLRNRPPNESVQHAPVLCSETEIEKGHDDL